MIVVGIIGNPGSHRRAAVHSLPQRGFRAELQSDLKNAYTAAQAYFSDLPGGDDRQRRQAHVRGLARFPPRGLGSGDLRIDAGTVSLTHSQLAPAKEHGVRQQHGCNHPPGL
jgi:hypothetical protein